MSPQPHIFTHHVQKYGANSVLLRTGWVPKQLQFWIRCTHKCKRKVPEQVIMFLMYLQGNLTLAMPANASAD